MNSVESTPCGVGCPIRTFPDQSLLATPRNLSQRATSFIASQCQGIHQMLLSCLILIRSQNQRTDNRGRRTEEICRPLSVVRRPLSAPRRRHAELRETIFGMDMRKTAAFFRPSGRCFSSFKSRQEFQSIIGRTHFHFHRSCVPCGMTTGVITNVLHHVQDRAP
jgi:hypothetical protein